MKKRVLFFDGFCHLCNGYINILVKLKPSEIFFASLQGSTASLYLSPHQMSKMDSLIYYKNKKIFEKSNAVIESLFDVSFLFFWIKLLYFIPRFIRDFIYDWIALRRYQVFGKSSSCRIPSNDEKKYILD